jgi:pyruvate/oxaloacetate carboxyltransferase
MKLKALFTITVAVAALAVAALLPEPTHGVQEPIDPATDPAPVARATSGPKVAALIAELQAQQKALAGNQSKIDEQIAAIAEDVRQARMFVSRGGSK